MTTIDPINKPIAEPVWYRQFWPWFLIALPATVVVAGFYTMFIAFKYSDTLVSDNYYKDGLAINQVLTQDIRAQQMDLSASISFQQSASAVSNKAGADIVRADIARADIARANTAPGAENAADTDPTAVLIKLSGDLDLPDRLTLRLEHPTDFRADRTVIVMSVGEGHYRGSVLTLPAYRFYLRLIPGLIETPDQEKQVNWRLNGELDFASTDSVKLQAVERDQNSLND